MSLIRKMDSEFTGSNPGYEAAVMTGLYDLILFLSRSQDSCRGSQSVTRLAGLFSALEASFQEDWPLERMAKFTSMSINTLLRAFQSAAKQTPLSYLNSLRLNAAGHLLLESDRPVTEIALSCGFHCRRTSRRRRAARPRRRTARTPRRSRRASPK